MRAVLFAVIFGVASVASVAFGDMGERVTAYILGHGAVVRPELVPMNDGVLCGWRYAFPEPTEATLPSAEVAQLVLGTPEKYRKRVGNELAIMTDEEKAVVDAAELAVELVRQAAKPIERKVAENTYLTLCATALAAAGDARSTNLPPVKLTFPELSLVMDAIMQADAQAAIVLTLKMLATDAALKRYDMLWWEDAQWHAEIVTP